MALPKPAGVNGLPYAVMRKVRWPDRVAAIVAASSGCKGISTWIGWRCSFLAWVKRTRPSRTCCGDLGDLRLIALPVEFRLDGAWRGHHLAQGQGGGENLDEERFHLTLHLRKTRTQ
jgi:hypothetical protein